MRERVAPPRAVKERGSDSSFAVMTTHYLEWT
jgi:hypothetical protein